MRRLIVALFLVGCASPGFPRGAPPDELPPEVLRTVPDSSATGFDRREVEIFFDEVVSERVQGAPNLAALVLISPEDGTPRVDWNRRSLGIRPRGGWRDNTTYTVTLLPGLVDLQNNARRRSTSIVFSTGAELAQSTLGGIVFDWPAGRPSGRALVKAVQLPDSVTYVTVADSTGRFRFRNLPAGDFEVTGILDANNNRVPDPTELLGTVTLQLGDSADAEILAFRHDSIPPLATVTVTDTFTIRVRFDRPVDPEQAVDTSLIRILAMPDSTVVPLALVRAATAFENEQRELAAAQMDSAQRAAAAQRDSILAARAGGAPELTQAVVPSRPRPPTEFVVQVSTPLQQGVTYVMFLGEVRGMLGAARAHTREFRVPARAAAPAATSQRR